jgi:hypothetical protein
VHEHRAAGLGRGDLIATWTSSVVADSPQRIASAPIWAEIRTSTSVAV